MDFGSLLAKIERALGKRWKPISVLLSLTFVLLPAPALSQATIQGTVTDESGQPLVGAQVRIVGTDQGSVTNLEGRYQVDGVEPGPIQIQAIYLGYREESRAAQVSAGTNRVDFVLVSSPIELDAIVVTGTAGATQKRAIGNAIVEIEADEVLEKAPVTNLGELIQGRAAGAVVLPSSGSAGTGAAIHLRGLSSITQTNQPLLYVDGVRVANTNNDYDFDVGADRFHVGGQGPSRLNDINIQDIESIEIIKGPAASTLYGTEAAAGVIQIITKKGRSGEPRWNVHGSWGRVDLGNHDFPDNFAAVAPAAVPEGPGVRIVKTLPDEQLLIANNPIESIRKTGIYQEYDLSVSGGREDFTFYGSGNFMTEGGVTPANFAEKIGGRANLQWTPSEVFDIAVSTGYINNEIRLPNNDNDIFGFWGNALLSSPAFIFVGPGANFQFGEPFTPLSQVALIDSRFTNDRFTGSVTANFAPFPWLKNRAIFGIDVNAEENFQFIPFGAVSNLSPRGEKKNIRSDITFDYNGTVTWDLSPDLQSSSSVGTQVTNENVDTVTAFGKDFPDPTVSTVSAAGQREGFETRVEDVTVGVYFQEQIAWQNRLFLTGAVRFDDNSAFGANFDFETYPKVSASWVVSEEPFFEMPVVDMLRLRTAYGFAGQQPAAFAEQRQFNAVAIRGGVPTVTPDQFGNPDLGPERSREIEVGFDAGLWDDRIGVGVTYYDKVTEDALVARTVAPSSGFPTSQLTNLGEVQNSGWELSVDGLLVDTPRVDYHFSLNLATNDNEVTSLGGEPGFPTPGSFDQRIEEGFPLDGIWGRVIAGRDENGDLILSDEDEFLGRVTPDLAGSWGSTVTLWDNLQLYALLSWKRGFVIENRALPFRFAFESERALFDPGFLPEQELNDLFSFIDAGEPTPFVDDGDFVKLREVSATYTLPEAWATALRAQRASVTISARNLKTWTDYFGVDPEVNGSGQNDLVVTDFFTVPQARRITTSLHLTF
ncbi:MAG: SusC/RagA family TonB-linked outer membrane protein [Gemmatimonadota bacterium]